jgi:hypothetical protein
MGMGMMREERFGWTGRSKWNFLSCKMTRRMERFGGGVPRGETRDATAVWMLFSEPTADFARTSPCTCFIRGCSGPS